MIDEIDFHTLMTRCYMGYQWTVSDNKLLWNDESPMPSDDELIANWKEIHGTEDPTAYIRKRRQAYPKCEELIVALWEWLVDGDDRDIVKLQKRRLEVKSRFPKVKYG